MNQAETPIDVFLSYKREDREVAKALAEVLARRGYSVWWDVDLLPGDRFADEIMAVIKRAKATLVLWSRTSVASSFVRAEATVADKLGRLIPARLDDCELPLPFNVLHTHDLTSWSPGAGESRLAPIFNALESRTGKAPTAAQEPAAAADNLHRQDREAELWRSISEKPEAAADEYAVYLSAYPNGAFANLARMRRAKLQIQGAIKKAKNVTIALGGLAGAIAAIVGLLAAAHNYLPTFRQWTMDLVLYLDQDPPYESGDSFRDCADCPEMVVVPAGSFMMGSPEDEKGRSDREGPRHQVTIAEPFAIGIYEVTFDEWDACVAAGGCNGYRPKDRDWGRGRRPVIHASWNDAKAYVEWLNANFGAKDLYRLPSEAEWEYAARAGTTTPFHFGPTISTDQANYNGNLTYGSGVKGKYRGQAVPVGLFPANDFGLHDVHGNVGEWVQDCWNGSYAGVGRPDDGTAWTTDDCGRRVLRGGSWLDYPSFLRSAYRSWNDTGHWDFDLGFRVARTLH